MLTKFPPEVLGLVIENLRKVDLKSLSLVSKHLHGAVAKALWQSITIESASEYDLHRIPAAALLQASLQIATKLRFYSDFECLTKERCPHMQEYEKIWYTDDEDELDAEDIDEDDEDKDQPYIDRLAAKAESVLGRLKDGQLRSFSWDLGTCVPIEILGKDGIVSLKHPLLRSLSLTTDCTCLDADAEIDLSSFHQLQSLCWRAPHSLDLETLSVAIRQNCTHLQKLELDFVNWPALRDSLYMNDEEDEDDTAVESYFTRELLHLNRCLRPPLFPAIRVLSLSQVPLGTVMAGAINFDTLTSLTLRRCPAWDQFLERIIQLNRPIKLKTLEIQHLDYEAGQYAIMDFLNAFEGLEELCISHPGPEPSLDIWESVVRHHGTLKRFVHHQRTINLDDESPYFEEEYDLPDLAIIGRDMRRTKEDPSQNPLARLNLAFVGLACIPQRLRFILLPFTSKASLKVLHIRQSGSDLKHYASWGVDNHPTQVNSDTTSVASSENGTSSSWADSDITDRTSDAAIVTRRSDISAEYELQDEFRQFADWAFGPQGLASLQAVIFGDFGPGDWTMRDNIILCRSTDENSNFRFLGEGGLEWEEVLDEYRNVIEACPVEPLFKE